MNDSRSKKTKRATDDWLGRLLPTLSYVADESQLEEWLTMQPALAQSA